MTPLTVYGRGDVRAKLTGLHTATKRLADKRVCVYAYIERGGPLLAKGVGRDLASANAALEAALGSAEALRRLSEIKAEAGVLRPRQSDRHVFGLVTAFLASPDFAKLGDRTQASYRDYLERFRAEFGEYPIKLFGQPRGIEDLIEWRDEMRETPRTADYVMATVGRLFAWARERQKTDADPTKDISKLHTADRSDVIWTAADLVKFCATASKPLKNAVLLAAYTGLRQGDLLRLTWANVSDVAITLKTRKRNRLAIVPIIPDARKLLAEVGRPKDQTKTVLTSSHGTAWTSDGLRTSFGKARDAAGIGKHFHDLRGTAATRFAASGNLTNAEIATVMGWAPERVEQLKMLYVSSDVVALDLLARMSRQHGSTNRRQTGVKSPKSKGPKS